MVRPHKIFSIVLIIIWPFLSFTQPAVLTLYSGEMKAAVISNVDHQVITNDLEIIDINTIESIQFSSRENRYLKRYQRLNEGGIVIHFDEKIKSKLSKMIDEDFNTFLLVQREINLILKDSTIIETSFSAFTYYSLITPIDTIPFSEIRLAEFDELYDPFYKLYTRLYKEKIKVIYYRVNERPWTFRPKKVSKIKVNDKLLRVTDSTRALVKDRGYLFCKTLGDETDHLVVLTEAYNFEKKINTDIANPHELLLIRPKRYQVEITTTGKSKFKGFYTGLGSEGINIIDENNLEQHYEAEIVDEIVFRKALFGASSASKVIKILTGGLNVVASVYTGKKVSLISFSIRASSYLSSFLLLNKLSPLRSSFILSAFFSNNFNDSDMGIQVN